MSPKKQVRIQLEVRLRVLGPADAFIGQATGNKVFDRRVGPVIDSNHVRDAFDGPVCGSDN